MTTYDSAWSLHSLGPPCIVLSAPYQRLKDALARWHPPTAEHSIRVRILAVELGIASGLSGAQLTALSVAAELHDIGKIRVPPSVLEGLPGTSTADGYYALQHPVWGAQIASDEFGSESDITQCIREHHECEDGSGYPNHLIGNSIHPLAKVVAVADAFVCLIGTQSRRGRATPGEALRILLDDKRRKLDTVIVRTLAHMMMHTTVAVFD